MSIDGHLNLVMLVTCAAVSDTIFDGYERCYLPDMNNFTYSFYFKSFI